MTCNSTYAIVCTVIRGGIRAIGLHITHYFWVVRALSQILSGRFDRLSA